MVLGLIETVDVVMNHISSNLHASEPQVAIMGSSSMAGTGQVGGTDRWCGRDTRGQLSCGRHRSTRVLGHARRRAHTHRHTVPRTPRAQITRSAFQTLLSYVKLHSGEDTVRSGQVCSAVRCTWDRVAFEGDSGARVVSHDQRLSSERESSSRGSFESLWDERCKVSWRLGLNLLF